jgi:type IV pilus assembly protein PilA
MLIVIAIIGILASLAVPQYQSYTDRAKFVNIVSGVDPIKTAIIDCFTDKGQLSSCITPYQLGFSTDSNLTWNSTADLLPNAYYGSLSVTFVSANRSAEIEAVASASGGFTRDARGSSYILDVVEDNSSNLVWALSSRSTCLLKKLCNKGN